MNFEKGERNDCRINRFIDRWKERYRKLMRENESPIAR